MGGGRSAIKLVQEAVVMKDGQNRKEMSLPTTEGEAHRFFNCRIIQKSTESLLYIKIPAHESEAEAMKYQSRKNESPEDVTRPKGTNAQKI